ncbi:hypothetical protein NC653_029074 [Populus alba x Populus x berolinensis]|uniref:Uncharacterized protein n=1 Tax=Populus alba x Populus x berolinensis TaxID=444605 RepID=A0AAD6M1K9_9ROSI|nr:hypothetical protein NC653_029074 [Populus alba x Populus x berolinensis]
MMVLVARLVLSSVRVEMEKMGLAFWNEEERAKSLLTDTELELYIEAVLFDAETETIGVAEAKARADVETNKEAELLCNIMGRSEFCEIKGDIRIDRNSSTV